ncbi:hypothetical protein [Methyloferula stellata]|uniref:hypothetical protein n=1 Tax=Methyloferula stellata TaxID=876270 RepID=UPI0013762A50|nr:hypothetical protein [Methyloferula stellata]
MPVRDRQSRKVADFLGEIPPKEKWRDPEKVIDFMPMRRCDGPAALHEAASGEINPWS